MESQTDATAALLHCVYRDLLTYLPIASVGQAETFAANLALMRTGRSRREVFRKLLWLKVSPDIAEATTFKWLSKFEIEILFAEKYGDRLAAVPGFYLNDRWRVNLPKRCAFLAYRNRHQAIRGILCQPLDSFEYYFLLSSLKFGGARALRMERFDQEFFESYKEPFL